MNEFIDSTIIPRHIVKNTTNQLLHNRKNEGHNMDWTMSVVKHTHFQTCFSKFIQSLTVSKHQRWLTPLFSSHNPLRGVFPVEGF